MNTLNANGLGVLRGVMGWVVGASMLGLSAPAEAMAEGPKQAAERSACEGLEASVRTRSPLDGLRILSVEPVRGPVFIGAKPLATRLAGAKVTVAAEPQVTVAWLERLALCHQPSATDEANPFAVASVRVRVKEAQGSFAFEVTAPTREGAEDVWQRAKKLAPAR